jgi:16S rRNA (cytosine967-C5)-methyltransferase
MTRKQVDIDSIILELWERTDHGQMLAGKALEEVFAREDELSDGQRDFIVATLFGLLSSVRRLDHALQPGGGALPAGTSRPLAQLLAHRLLAGRLSVAQAEQQVPTLDWQAVLAADKALAREPDPVKRLAVMASLPDFLVERLFADYGAETEDLAHALNRRAPLMLRVNTLKASRQKVLGTLAKAGLDASPARFSMAGVELESRTNVFTLPQFASGHIEVQDEASQLAAELVAPPPKGLVVDYCAGAGGKTLAVGALMGNAGRLIALDVNKWRLDEFRRRARRAGLTNARAIHIAKEGQWPDEVQQWAGKADRVLVDVPCSGVGSFRRKPEMRWRLKAADLRRLPDEQEAIARRALELCAPGGRLIYATCTLLNDENERVIERLLQDPTLEVMPVKLIFGKAVAAPITDPSGTFLKLFPHRHDCDGFFAAVLRKRRPPKP